MYRRMTYGLIVSSCLNKDSKPNLSMSTYFTENGLCMVGLAKGNLVILYK